MILEIFPSLRPPKQTHQVAVFGKPPQQQPLSNGRPNLADQIRADKLKITPQEFVRRDMIIRQMWIDCPFHVGESVVAKTEENRKKYGKLFVRGIIKTYFDFSSTEKWPKDDRPYIITCSSEHEGEIICTSEFLQKGNHGGTC